MWKSARTVTTTIGVDVGGTKVSVATLRDGHLDDPVLAPTVTSSPRRSSTSSPSDREAAGAPTPSASASRRSSTSRRHRAPLGQHPAPGRAAAPSPHRAPRRPGLRRQRRDGRRAGRGPRRRRSTDRRHLVMFTIGTGVGGGIVIGGRIYRGATGAARRARPPARRRRPRPAARRRTPTSAPQPGSLEHLAAGRALDRAGRRARARRRTARRGGRPRRRPAWPGGDPHPRRAARRRHRQRDQRLRPRARRHRRRRLRGRRAAAASRRARSRGASSCRASGRRTEIRLARYGPQAGVRGAALMAGPSCAGLGPDPRDLRSAMRIAVAFDHAGVPLREAVVAARRGGRARAVDLGIDDDYPDSALKVGRSVAAGEAQRGIIVCGSGAGVSVAACKLPGIRAACAHDHYTAAQCVTHDDCNVLCLGARVIGSAIATELVTAFLRRRVLRRGAPRPPPGEGREDGGRGIGGILVSADATVNERLAAPHRGRHERLAGPDPAHRSPRAASCSGSSRRTRCAA